MWLLDTNVLSELRKVPVGRADPAVVAWATYSDLRNAYIAAVTLHEVEVGVLQLERRDPLQGRRLRLWFEESILGHYGKRVLPMDDAVARQAATYHVPDRRPINDAYIAATAVVNGMTLVTRNVRDFAGLDVAMLNPWEFR